MRRMYSKPQLLEAVEQESKLNGIKVFEDIKDKDGHYRFIEGDITPKTISGFTFTYSKWALSGNHLIIVVCFDVEDTTTISAATKICDVDLPQWIKDKIYTIQSGSNVAYQNLNLIATSLSVQGEAILMQKVSNVISIYLMSALTLTAKRTGRVQIDLLIDNE